MEEISYHFNSLGSYTSLYKLTNFDAAAPMCGISLR